MSSESDKFKNSRRRLKDATAVTKQIKIAQAHRLTNKDKVIKEPHRMVKHHAMDCGQPRCALCGNPRQTHKDKLTQQEKSLFQDLDHVSDKHSNGLVPPEE